MNRALDNFEQIAVNGQQTNWVFCTLGKFLIQGCINCGILVSGIRARGVSSEDMENMEMFSCSPT